MKNEQQITLATLGGGDASKPGGAEEMFAAELQKVLRNVQDPNTEPKVIA